MYKFLRSEMDRTYAQGGCRGAVKLMREAVTAYLLASFDPTTMLSSM
ncbi:MAG: hypothetical protein ACYDCP_00430 [Thermoplasmataceae archaeon]